MGQVNHIGQLVPDPRNARRHTPRNVGMIASALNEVGAARSIVIDEDNVILAGNATIEAAAQAGIERVRVVEADGNEIIAVRRSGMTAKQKKRLALYDNRTAELAEWEPQVLLDDKDILDGLFNTDELDAILRGLTQEPVEDPGAQIDRAAELQEKWQTSRGQLWQIGQHRLLCGDSTSADDTVRLFDGAEPALMVTDPPYGVEYEATWRNEAAAKGLIHGASRREGRVANDDRVDWREAWALFPGDIVYCWHSGYHTGEVEQQLRDTDFEIRAHIIWRKPHFTIGRGHYHWQHEGCWYGVKKGAQAHWLGGHSQTTVWDIELDANAEGGHSAQKPVECMARPLRNHAGDVYEPFLGSGTTMVAAEQTGRTCYGMEIEPKYVAVTLERMAGMGLEPRLTCDG